MTSWASGAALRATWRIRRRIAWTAGENAAMYSLTVVDRVLRIVHDAVEPQRRATVVVDLALQKMPAGLAFLAMGATDTALLDLRRKAMGVSLGVVVLAVVRRAR